MQINDKVKIVKLRIKNREVDDIDYFKFPKKYLLKNNIDKSNEDYALERKKYGASKQVMIK